MSNIEKVFYDGLETVRLTEGVIHLEFFNLVKNGKEAKRIPAGEVIMSQSSFLRAYGAMTDLVDQLEKAGLVKRTPSEPGKKAETGTGSPNFE